MSVKSMHSEQELKPGRLIARARQRAGLSLRELATRSGTSHSTIAAYESGRKMPSAEVLIRLLNSCDQDLTLVHSPRLHVDEDARGYELEQVLELAEQFPARHRTNPRYPKFGYDQPR